MLTLMLAVNMVPSLALAQDVDGTETEVTGEMNGQKTGMEDGSAVMDNPADGDSDVDINVDNSSMGSTESTEEDAAPEASTEEEIEEETEEVENDQSEGDGVSITYSGHAQTYGDLKAVNDGAQLGSTGQGKRLEAFKINKGDALKDIEGDIVYRAHVQTYGTQDWVKNGALSGTTGKSKRVEAIQIYLTGELAEKYDIYYMTHIQTYGWTKWVKGSQDYSGWCGSSGYSKRMEAIKIQLVKKDGGTVPTDSNSFSYVTPTNIGTVVYSGHAQSYGNLAAVGDGTELGSTGKGKRLEAVKISKGDVLSDIQGDIVYRTHVQSYGNQGWVKNGALSGTTGKSKRIEAIQIYLTGELAEQYDIYYMTHIQTFGWTKWVKGSQDDSSWCGSSGLAKRMEAIKIQLVKKDGGTVPTDGGNISYATASNIAGISYAGYQQTSGNLTAVSDGTTLGVTGQERRLESVNISLHNSVYSGSVTYRAHVESTGWQDWVSDGAMSGTSGQNKRLEAIQIKLTGDIAKYCDVWYRVHAQGYGWLGWAKNGQSAGTSNLSKRVEAIQIKIVTKGGTAPGANSGYYVTMSAAQQRVNSGIQKVYNQVGRNLYSCYTWCVNNIRYASLGSGVPSGYTNTQWFALYGLENHYGDCRTYAATFYQLAKGLGYNARYVYGYVPSVGGGMIDHAWVEIDMSGTTYVFDTDFQYETGRNGYQFRYGTSGTWRYTNYHYEN